MESEKASPQCEQNYLKPASNYHCKCDILNRDAPHFWFKKFIRFHRYLGVTYRGSAGFDGSIPDRNRRCLIIYDLSITFGLTTYFFINYFLCGRAIFENSKQDKILMEAITKIGTFATGLQFVALKMVLLLYGDRILKIICSFDCPARDGFKVSLIQKLIFKEIFQLKTLMVMKTIFRLSSKSV
jgi:hypothetical protein